MWQFEFQNPISASNITDITCLDIAQEMLHALISHKCDINNVSKIESTLNFPTKTYNNIRWLLHFRHSRGSFIAEFYKCSTCVNMVRFTYTATVPPQLTLNDIVF